MLDLPEASHMPPIELFYTFSLSFRRPGGLHAPASQGNSFSFHGNTATSATTPRLPRAGYNDGAAALGGGPDTFKQELEGHEVEGPLLTCHCGLPCNKLEAKTEKNAGRCALSHVLLPSRAGFNKLICV